MLREIINILPPRIISFICISSLMLTTYVAAYFSTRFFEAFFSQDDRRKAADSVIAVMGGGFTFLLSFVFYNCWNYSLQVRNFVVQEANTVAILIQQAKSLPKDSQTVLQGALKAYVVAVRTDEWHSMRHGKESPYATLALQQIFDVLPQSKMKNNTYLHGQLISQAYHLVELRRNRLSAVSSVIPHILFEGIVLGSFVLTAVAGFLRGVADPMRVLAFSTLAFLIGFNLSLVVNFYYAFSGGFAVANTPFYEGILAQL